MADLKRGIAGSVVGAPGTIVGGFGGDISDALGLGKQGEYFQQLNPEGSLQNSLNGLWGGNGNSGPSLEADVNGTTGSALAAQQVQGNPLLQGIFSSQGKLRGDADSALADEKDLRDNGFKLNEQDNNAYGQASGNIARMYGQQEQSLSQSLADRGFGGSPNNMATAQFSGLQGNKNEQLAQAQTQIANQRMQNATTRLANTRQYLSQLGGLQNQQAEGMGKLTNDQYNRQLSGQQFEQGKKNDLFNAENQFYNTSNNWALQSLNSKVGQQTPTLGQYFGYGLGQSATALGKVPGQVAGSIAGGAAGTGGSASGGQLASQASKVAAV